MTGQSRKVRISLAQKNLRPLLFNFYPYLRLTELDPADWPRIKPHQVYNVLGPYEQEIKRRKGNNWRFAMRQMLGLPSIRLLHDKKHDLIFSYGGLLVCNKPYIVYLENDAAPYSYNANIADHPLARYLVSWRIKHDSCRSVIFMSEACRRGFLAPGFLADGVRAAVAAKAKVLAPIAKNPGRPDPVSYHDGIIRFLFIGSFYMKGGQELVNAFERLTREKNNVRLTVITKVELLAPSDKKKLESNKNIELVTNQYDTNELFQRFYNTHDVFVYPTYRDSFGAVLVEALAAGLPIITTDHYATTEMAVNGLNAFVYPNHPLKDYDENTGRILGKYYSPQDFYDDLFCCQRQHAMAPIVDFIYYRMKELVDNPERRRTMGAESMKRYQARYNWQKTAAAWDEIFVHAASPEL